MKAPNLYKPVSAVILAMLLSVFFVNCANNKKGYNNNRQPAENNVQRDSSSSRQNTTRGGGMMNGGMMGNGMMHKGMMSSGTSNETGTERKKEIWKAPADADKTKNPITDIISAAKTGKNIFEIQCSACHGNDAKGDGPSGKMLNPKPSDLTSGSVQAQSDGALFWKITNGKSPMPAFEGILNPKQRWEIIKYLRSLKKH